MRPSRSAAVEVTSLNVVPGDRRPAVDSPEDSASGVDLELLDPRRASQVVLVRGFDPRLPDLVARLVALVLADRELAVVDLADEAQQVSGEGALRVGPLRQPHPFD